MLELGLGLGLQEKFMTDFQLATVSDPFPGDNLLLVNSTDNFLLVNSTDTLLLV